MNPRKKSQNTTDWTVLPNTKSSQRTGSLGWLGNHSQVLMDMDAEWRAATTLHTPQSPDGSYKIRSEGKSKGALESIACFLREKGQKYGPERS